MGHHFHKGAPIHQNQLVDDGKWLAGGELNHKVISILISWAHAHRNGFSVIYAVINSGLIWIMYVNALVCNKTVPLLQAVQNQKTLFIA